MGPCFGEGGKTRVVIVGVLLVEKVSVAFRPGPQRPDPVIA